MHRETSKFKQSVLTRVSPVSSIGTRAYNITVYISNPDNNIMWGNETDWTRSASSDMRIFSPDVRMQTLQNKVIIILLITLKLLMNLPRSSFEVADEFTQI